MSQVLYRGAQFQDSERTPLKWLLHIQQWCCSQQCLSPVLGNASEGHALQSLQSRSGGSLVKQGNTHAPHKRVQHQVLPHHASASVHACCRAASQSPHISVHPQHRRDSVAYAGASCWYATSLRPLKPIHRAGQHRIVRSATPCLLELE